MAAHCNRTDCINAIYVEHDTRMQTYSYSFDFGKSADDREVLDTMQH